MSRNKMKPIVVKLEKVSEKDFLKLLKHRIKSANKEGKCISVSTDKSNVEQIYCEDKTESINQTGYEEIIIRIEV